MDFASGGHIPFDPDCPPLARVQPWEYIISWRDFRKYGHAFEARLAEMNRADWPGRDEVA